MLRWLIALLLLATSAGQPCPNSCNSHGRCSDASRVCDCFDGFTGINFFVLIAIRPL